ncbi:MAG: STAS/SEC14 domain-containing protein [Candidatus Aminicenantes bacterium]|nr:STAS/SEC14 domain-containing protein [Candidatus Aminicenantes bacterium]
MTEKIIETRVSKTWLGDDGILRESLFRGAGVTLDDMKEIIAAQFEFTKEKKVPLLVDMRTIKSTTRDARVYASSEKTEDAVSAVALLVSSPVSKVLGNFFIGVNKPPYPRKLFTSETNAVEWLKKFLPRDPG